MSCHILVDKVKCETKNEELTFFILGKKWRIYYC